MCNMEEKQNLKIAYLAHEFPVFVEHYFRDDVEALRSRNYNVLIYACIKMKVTSLTPEWKTIVDETFYLDQFRPALLIRTAWLSLKSLKRLKDIYLRLFIGGNEGFRRRLKGVLHTVMGIYFAVALKDQKVVHIHVHHGYLASWVAMIASRLLGITFSMTLHGSDLLIDRVYLDLKLNNCSLCFTISNYNKGFLLQTFPTTDPKKVIVNYLGVEPLAGNIMATEKRSLNGIFNILTVGRLESVKNHEFLIRSCADLKQMGFKFKCLIIGDGKLRKSLESLIQMFDLCEEVILLGFIDRQALHSFYRQADLFVITSKSEGLPIVLMEAMLNGTIVLAPDINGIPEIVINGRTGFLYKSGNKDEFISKIQFIHGQFESLNHIEKKARLHVLDKFNKQKNMDRFAELLRSHLHQIHTLA